MPLLSPDFLALQAAFAGEYSLERELGRGGMGVVYLARDVQLDRLVAIKVLPQDLAEQPEFRERFVREARTAAGLSHPNIVPIHRVGEAAGFVFFVMTYVAGKTLGERLRDSGPLGAADAMRLLREVAWALAYAHGRGIVHRDVKPDNIIIEEGTGRALVMDFGIAHVGTSTLSTAAGKIMGTAHFMSPEQAMSEPVDGRSDLYSLGVVGYLAVSGRLPFEASNVPALLLKQVNEVPRALAEVAPGTPPALSAAIERCLQKEPAARFADGEGMAAALTPETDGRPELPLPLRNWLSVRNPAVYVYGVWSALFFFRLLFDISGSMQWHLAIDVVSTVVLLGVAAAPLIPIVGFHATQARRLFAAGFTLADLRGALDVEQAEQTKGALRTKLENMTPAKYGLRTLMYGSVATALTATFFGGNLRVYGSLREQREALAASWILRHGAEITLTAWIASAVLLAACNMNGVPILPQGIRNIFRVPLRDRLWRSRFGAWLARRLGEPAESRPVAAGIFRPTEVALGAALVDLYASLPKPFREQLVALPPIVSALEQRARDARRDVELLDAQPPGSEAVDELRAQRRNEAKVRLRITVAALEGIRLDLLRLHSGSVDLTSLTTLLDAARLLGDDVNRLTVGQEEVAQVLSNLPVGPRRVATPA